MYHTTPSLTLAHFELETFELETTLLSASSGHSHQ
jgi:hypothetical protein